MNALERQQRRLGLARELKTARRLYEDACAHKAEKEGEAAYAVDMANKYAYRLRALQEEARKLALDSANEFLVLIDETAPPLNPPPLDLIDPAMAERYG